MLCGNVVVSAKSAIEELTSISLDLCDNMHVDSISGNLSSFQHVHDRIDIELDKQYATDKVFTLKIYYHGTPELQNSSVKPVLFDKIDDHTIICAESCPFYAKCWWPCKDIPSDKADSIDIKITVPADLKVASNGILMDISDAENRTRTYHWQVKNPISTYLITFTAANYVEFSDVYVSPNQDSMDIIYYILPNHSLKAKQVFKTIPHMIDVLAQYFGEYPFLNEKYGIAEYVTEWAAMEYQTLSCFNSRAITDEKTILHELAHQWWGNCVTPSDFHHVWLSEGFAVFSEALYLGATKGQKYYHQHFDKLIFAYNEFDTLYQHNISTPQEIYPMLVYHKGAWVLHMLRHVVGEEYFWASLKEFRRCYEYATATTEDLQMTFETVSGLSLGWFFRQWVYQPSYPIYHYGWWQKKLSTGKYHISGFIDRIQTDFVMPIEITFRMTDADTTISVWVDENTEQFECYLPQKITDVILDAENWILKKTKKISRPKIIYQSHDLINIINRRNPTTTAYLLRVELLNQGLPVEDIKVKLKSNDASIKICKLNGTIAQLEHLEEGYVEFELQRPNRTEKQVIEFYLNITDDFHNKTEEYFSIEFKNLLSE